MSTISNTKLPGIGSTIFSVMSKLASEHNAINLAQGFPDFEGPKFLRDRVSHHLGMGHNQYAPLQGVPALLEQIAQKVDDLYGCRVDAGTQITVTPGATEGIFCALSALVHPGDEVIVIDPAYDTYVPGIILNGGVPRRVSMDASGNGIDWQQIADNCNERTRVLMINTPHNPSGYCLGQEDIDALRSLMNRHNFFVISDEVYEHIVFDGKEHLSLLRFPDIFERALVISSFGKTYHVTGWRIGYCIAPPALMTEFVRIHQFINFSTNTPISYAIADFMQAHPEFPRQLAAFYQQKRNLFCSLLEDSRFALTPAAGTYFQTVDYSAISDEPDVEFARRLTMQHGVGAIPVSVFCEKPPAEQVVRFCFAKEDETLRQAAIKLIAV